MGRQIEQLAEFVARTRWEDIPEAVQRHAKMVLLDTLGVCRRRGATTEVPARIGGAADGGATGYTRGWPRQDAHGRAAQRHRRARHRVVRGLRLVSGQAAIQILPGVLALTKAQLSGAT